MKMDIDFFFPETVSIEHSNGNATSGIRAQIEKSDQIILFGNSIVVSVDDIVVHPLDNGAIHRFSVTDVSYNRGFSHMPATTKLTVNRHGSRNSAWAAGQHVYNIRGNNARINVHSTDHSTNVVSSAPNVVFDRLRTALDTLPDDHPGKSEIVEMAATLSNTPLHTETFTERFQKFVALAANCMTIVGPFVPELAKFLGRS